MKRRLLFFGAMLIVSPVVFSNSIDDNKIPLSVSYTPSGLTFSALHSDFKTSLYGFVQADAMKIARNNQNLSSGANIRRARLYLNGSFNPVWSYNFSYEFRSKNILLAQVNYLGWKNMQLSMGQIFPSFSLNNSSAPAALNTLEPPLPVVAFSPTYSYYVGVGCNTWNDFLSLQLAAFGPSTSQTVNGRNPLGGTARLIYSPIHTETRMLDFGLAGWVQRPDGSNKTVINTFPEIKSSDFSGNAATTGAIINSGDIININNYGSVGAEIAGIYGPWSVQAEYLQMRVNRKDNNPSLKFSGYYVTASYFLTGESLAYTYPAAAFGGNIKIHNQKLGAWEVLARYSTVNLNDADITGGKERNVTLGLNWYLNQHLKFLMNYVYARAKPGSNKLDDNINTVAARLQVIF